MSKRYRLKRDLPGANKGDEVVPTSGMAHGIIKSGYLHLEWGSDFVMNQPERQIGNAIKEAYNRLEQHIKTMKDSNEFYSITFPLSAHGFKTSPTLRDRLYFYPDQQYKMDMMTIPPKRWIVNNILENKKAKTVILKSV